MGTVAGRNVHKPDAVVIQDVFQAVGHADIEFLAGDVQGFLVDIVSDDLSQIGRVPDILNNRPAHQTAAKDRYIDFRIHTLLSSVREQMVRGRSSPVLTASFFTFRSSR